MADTETHLFGLRTAANREDQVVDYLVSKFQMVAKKYSILAVIKAHGMRGYIFIEASSKEGAEADLQGVPYARGLLPTEIPYQEIEHMLEQVKVEMNIHKGEIVVELLESAVPIPITVKMDAVKVVRRDEDAPAEDEN